MRIVILTISDRSSRGEREDSSGPIIADMIQQAFSDATIIHMGIIPDERHIIGQQLKAWSASQRVDVILTTGGTGFAPRDVTPEATRDVIEREAPGMAEAMRAASLQKTPHAMLSRGVVGIRQQTLIINLPGSPKAVRENLEVLLPVLPHAVELLQDDPDAEAGHQLA
ncbi:molybdopterin adenylyltransferase [Chloroflexota bacterium]